LTPYYFFEEYFKHIHMVQKKVCDKFDSSFYPRFKNWCDDYLLIKHHGERNELGGILIISLALIVGIAMYGKKKKIYVTTEQQLDTLSLSQPIPN
jgi:hypothetical protein